MKFKRRWTVCPKLGAKWRWGREFSKSPNPSFCGGTIKLCAGLARGRRTVLPGLGGGFSAFMVRFMPVVLITRLVEKALRPKADQA